jgi:hypothetical protein
MAKATHDPTAKNQFQEARFGTNLLSPSKITLSMWLAG